jgi:hypothetical protein
MHKARTIEQDIRRSGSAGGGGNGCIIQHIQHRRGDAWGREGAEQSRIAICCHHPRPFGGHSERGGAANTLASSGDETKLAIQSASHSAFLP